MERFFFHIAYGETTHDVVGTELPTLDAARIAAVRLLGEILQDEADKFWVQPDLTVTVADADDLTLWTLSTTGAEASSVSVRRASR